MKGKQKIKRYDFSRKKIIFVIFVFIFITGVFLIFQLFQINEIEIDSTFLNRAAIVDQLSSSFPNQSFVDDATTIMEKGNFKVDYYPSDMVTVDFFKNLPLYSYKLIILRVHSASVPDREFTVIFTSESYSTRYYVFEQLTEQIAKVSLITGVEPFYFAVTPNFIRDSMNGKFQNTTIIMMGCDGTTYNKTAKELVKKGISVYIGWNDLVEIHHTDKATICLLNYLITQKKPFIESVVDTMKIVGPDPSNGAVLNIFYKSM